MFVLNNFVQISRFDHRSVNGAGAEGGFKTVGLLLGDHDDHARHRASGLAVSAGDFGEVVKQRDVDAGLHFDGGFSHGAGSSGTGDEGLNQGGEWADNRSFVGRGRHAEGNQHLAVFGIDGVKADDREDRVFAYIRRGHLEGDLTRSVCLARGLAAIANAVEVFVKAYRGVTDSVIDDRDGHAGVTRSYRGRGRFAATATATTSCQCQHRSACKRKCQLSGLHVHDNFLGILNEAVGRYAPGLCV